jgi:hypothetical protein
MQPRLTHSGLDHLLTDPKARCCGGNNHLHLLASFTSHSHVSGNSGVERFRVEQFVVGRIEGQRFKSTMSGWASYGPDLTLSIGRL